MRRLLALMTIVAVLAVAAGCSNSPSASPAKANPTPDSKGNDANTGNRKMGDPR